MKNQSNHIRHSAATWLLLLAMLLIAPAAKAQSVIYSFHFDRVDIGPDEYGNTGSGRVDIRDDKTVLFTETDGKTTVTRSLCFQSISGGKESIGILFYAATGSNEEANNAPHMAIVSGGCMAIFYDGDNDKGAESFLLRTTEKMQDYNKATYDRLANDIDSHSGIFSNFRSEADMELPLQLNGYSTDHTVSVTAQASEIAYAVRTKTGKIVNETGLGDFEAWTDATWATIGIKTESAFLFKYEANTTGAMRSCNVFVKARDKITSMRVNQPALTAAIRNVWTEHNVRVGLMKGVKIHVAFDTYNVRGLQGQCSAFFYFANGQKLMDYNMQYRAVDGQVSTFQNFIPQYVNTTYSDLVLFLPYSELHLNGAASLKLQVQVLIGGQYATSDFFQFQMN